MILVENKKAFLQFSPQQDFAAGIELLGTEVKSLRAKQGSLAGSRVLVRGGEAFLVGMTIPPYQAANTAGSYDPERPRRLLLTKREIAELASAEDQKGLTVVPLSVYTNKNLVKVKLAIARGKKKEDRREDLKERDAARERERVVKSR